jgi:hypothetical protein
VKSTESALDAVLALFAYGKPSAAENRLSVAATRKLRPENGGRRAVSDRSSAQEKRAGWRQGGKFATMPSCDGCGKRGAHEPGYSISDGGWLPDDSPLVGQRVCMRCINKARKHAGLSSVKASTLAVSASLRAAAADLRLRADVFDKLSEEELKLGERLRDWLEKGADGIIEKLKSGQVSKDDAEEQLSDLAKKAVEEAGDHEDFDEDDVDELLEETVAAKAKKAGVEVDTGKMSEELKQHLKEHRKKKAAQKAAEKAKQPAAEPKEDKAEDKSKATLDDLRSGLKGLGWKKADIDKKVKELEPKAKKGVDIKELLTEAVKPPEKEKPLKPDAYKKAHGKCPQGFTADEKTGKCKPSGKAKASAPTLGYKTSLSMVDKINDQIKKAHGAPGELRWLKPDALKAGQRELHEGLVDGLIDAIEARHPLPPIVVNPSRGGVYQIFDGHHRWQAAKRLGLVTIPALVLPSKPVDPTRRPRTASVVGASKLTAKYWNVLTAKCLYCNGHLLPTAIVWNPHHIYNVGTMFTCRCDKSKVWTNSIRNEKAYLDFINGKTQRYFQGFCNDLFDGFDLARPLYPLENGISVAGERVRADRYGSNKAGSKNTQIAVWHRNEDGETDGPVSLTNFYRKFQDKIEDLVRRRGNE